MIAVFYGRVSTQRQENEATIENQLMACKDMLVKLGYQTFVKEYKDEGWSGTILARPALDQLRIDARNKLFDTVLIYDPDRVARKYSYQALVIDELEELGIKVIFVTTPPAETDEDKLLYGVKGLFAEYERARIIERFRIGKLRNAREGKVVISQAPYGYTYVPKQGDKHGYFEINEEEARVVRMIFNWIVEGVSLRAIIRKLQELNIKPQRSHREVWNTSTLVNMLRNRTYAGTAYFNRSIAIVPINPLSHEKYRKIKKTSKKLKPVEEWVPIPVPAIISVELFEQARKQLGRNFKFGVRNKKYDYLLSSLIQCICGHSRVGEGSQGGEHRYYRCSDRIYSFPLPAKCHERGINAQIADKLVWDKITRLLASPKLINHFVMEFVNRKQETYPKVNGSVEQLQKELGKLKDEERRYLKIYGSELISYEQLEKAVIELKAKKASIEGQLEELNKQISVNTVRLPSPEQIERFCKKALEILPDLVFERRQAILRRFVNRIIATQQKLEVYGSITFETLENVAFSSIRRYYWSAKCGQVHFV